MNWQSLIASRWMLFLAPLKSTSAGTRYQNTFPQASYEHIQALKILKVTHPFSVQQSVYFAANIKTRMRNVAFLNSPRRDARCSYQLLPQDAVIFQSPERRAQLWAADSPPCGQSWSYIQPQVHFWALQIRLFPLNIFNISITYQIIHCV